MKNGQRCSLEELDKDVLLVTKFAKRSTFFRTMAFNVIRFGKRTLFYSSVDSGFKDIVNYRRTMRKVPEAIILAADMKVNMKKKLMCRKEVKNVF